MFPTKFANDQKINISSHNAVSFYTNLSNKEVTKRLLKSVSEFLTQDVIPKGYGSTEKAFKDERIVGVAHYYSSQSCCAFTKDPAKWFLFPIHRNELNNVGLVEDDLIVWLKFLKDMKVGFKYLYLGEQEYNVKKSTNYPVWTHDKERASDNTFYWVAIPKFSENTLERIPYLHWICLRYLFGTMTSTACLEGLKPKIRLSYHNIPRITMFFHEKYRFTKLKSFLYAHLANPFFSGYGIAFTDYMGVKYKSLYMHDVDHSKNYQAPCVDITTQQFKELLTLPSNSNLMNSVLTKISYDTSKDVRNIPGLKNLDAPYNCHKLYELFDSEDYDGFIEHIRSSYGYSTSEKPAKSKKITSVKTRSRKKNVKKV